MNKVQELYISIDDKVLFFMDENKLITTKLMIYENYLE